MIDAVNETHSNQEDEINLRELAKAIWQGKWLIICITTLAFVCSVFYARSVPDEYKSTAILSPVSTSNASSLSRLAGQFGGLASMAGVSLGGSDGADKTMIAIELMQTWGFLEAFIKSYQIEEEVFAANGWDKLNNQLLFDGSHYDEWIKSEDRADEVKPTSWELYQGIKGRINIFQDPQSGLISLTIEHYSPVVAKRWVDLLVEAINKHIQSEDRKDALNSIDYLKNQINKTSIAEMRTIYYQLIEEQTKKLMLAEISSEYVFKTLSPAKVAEQKSKPKRSLIVVLGGMLGGMLAVMIVVVRFYAINEK